MEEPVGMGGSLLPAGRDSSAKRATPPHPLFGRIECPVEGRVRLRREQVPGTFAGGTDSHGELLPAQPNRAVFQPEETP